MDKLRNALQKSAIKETDLLYRERGLIEVLNITNHYIIFLNKLSAQLSYEIRELNEQSNLEINKLNENNKSLREIYKELEELKNKIITFQHFEGKFQNLICKNSQNKKEDICTKLEEDKKKQ